MYDITLLYVCYYYLLNVYIICDLSPIIHKNSPFVNPTSHPVITHTQYHSVTHSQLTSVIHMCYTQRKTLSINVTPCNTPVDIHPHTCYNNRVNHRGTPMTVHQLSNLRDYNDPKLIELWEIVKTNPEDCGHSLSLFRQQLLKNIRSSVVR